jgi:hypothetical protein
VDNPSDREDDNDSDAHGSGLTSLAPLLHIPSWTKAVGANFVTNLANPGKDRIVLLSGSVSCARRVQRYPSDRRQRGGVDLHPGGVPDRCSQVPVADPFGASVAIAMDPEFGQVALEVAEFDIDRHDDEVFSDSGEDSGPVLLV